MQEVFILLGGCTLLAFLYQFTCGIRTIENNGCRLETRVSNVQSNIIFFVLLFIMICFAGLRTRMNDTATYLAAFQYDLFPGLNSILDINWEIGNNPFFKTYQILLKTFISDSGYVFIFLTSAFIEASILLFFRKYADHFGWTVFLFIAFASYAFTMGAMKQSMATAIAIWAVARFLKGKKVTSVLLILFAMMFHPYVIIYFAMYFLSKDVWGKKNGIAIVITIFAGTVFSQVVATFMNFAGALGDKYELSDFTGQGVSIFRLLFYCIVPVLSFLNRESIRRTGNRFFYLSINLSVVSLCFMILASFGGANMFGRMSAYFDIFYCISLPVVLHYGEETRQYNRLIKYLLIPAFIIFYYKTYTKYLSYGSCFYNHISFIEMLKSW